MNPDPLLVSVHDAIINAICNRTETFFVKKKYRRPEQNNSTSILISFMLRLSDFLLTLHICDIK